MASGMEKRRRDLGRGKDRNKDGGIIEKRSVMAMQIQVRKARNSEIMEIIWKKQICFVIVSHWKSKRAIDIVGHFGWIHIGYSRVSNFNRFLLFLLSKSEKQLL